MKLSNNLSPEQLLQQSQSFQQSGNFEEAAVGFEKLRKLYPTYPPILNSLGIVYLQLGKLKDGCKLLEKSLQLDPKQTMIFYNLGQAYQNQGLFNESIKTYKKALDIQPDFIEAHNSLGVSLYNIGNFSEALKCFDHMITTSPSNPAGYNGRGISLYALGQYEESLLSLNKALAINNNFPELFNNIGLTLHKLNKFNSAIENFNQAIQLNPNYADAYNNRGLTLQAIKKTTEAKNDFNRCIELDAKHSDAHWNKALIKILLGDYEEGWQLYEWRWKSFSKKWARHYKEPLWLGEESLKGKSILIYPEQGYGDFIQFFRYISKLQALGAQVILEVPAALISLIRESITDTIVIESSQKPPRFDFQCPIMSLPLAFKTNLDTIPSLFPYLKTTPEKVSFWREKLGEKYKPRIGIVWSGSTQHKNDHNRSIKLQTLIPLTNLPLEFYSLQKEVRIEDEELLRTASIKDFRNDLENFSDTVALIELMDIVVTVDTSIAHLAGALNKNVCLLLPFNPDYRWMLNRLDSPWYPNIKLFRQNSTNSWTDQISAIKIHIQTIFQR
jgi:tetratricopeptide (TPR) repeat protein